MDNSNAAMQGISLLYTRLKAVFIQGKNNAKDRNATNHLL